MAPVTDPCNGVSVFGVSDSPCNTSTMNEWGVRTFMTQGGAIQ